MEHQDWKTIVWDKTNKQTNESKKDFIKRQSNSTTSILKTKSTINNVERRVLSKIDSEEENFKHKTVSRDISKNITKKRIELKMSQQDLARKLCLPENIIKSYEKCDGKAIYDPNILNKIEKVLGRVRS